MPATITQRPSQKTLCAWAQGHYATTDALQCMTPAEIEAMDQFDLEEVLSEHETKPRHRSHYGLTREEMRLMVTELSHTHSH